MTLRMPQVGERWRLRPRVGEAPARPCGCDQTQHAETIARAAKGPFVTIIPTGKRLRCGDCNDWEPMPEGYIGVRWNNEPYAVPYTWLEPIEEETP